MQSRSRQGFLGVGLLMFASSLCDNGQDASQGKLVQIRPAEPIPDAQPESREPIDLLFRLVDSQAFATLATLLASLMGFVGAQWIDRQKSRKEEDAKYQSLLTSTGNELEFYSDKLGVLASQLDDLVKDLATGAGVISVPTFSLYPDYLGQSKRQLGEFMRDADLTKKVGHCHYELAHVEERLNDLKASPPTGSMVDKSNAQSFASLVAEAKKAFDATRQAIQKAGKPA